MIVITGASSGIGKYLAENLYDKWGGVVGISSSDYTPPFVEVENYRCDVSKETNVREFFRSVKGEDIHAVINCAGRASMNSFLTTPVSVLDRLYKVNTRGTFLMSQYGAKHMIEHGGNIINFSTCAVPMAIEGELAYVSSKGAVEAMSRVMARELSPYHISVNVISPQPIMTPMLKNLPKEKIDKVIGLTAGKAGGSKFAILNLVTYILRSDNRQVTGMNFNLGGV